MIQVIKSVDESMNENEIPEVRRFGTDIGSVFRHYI